MNHLKWQCLPLGYLLGCENGGGVSGLTEDGGFGDYKKDNGKFGDLGLL